MSEESADRGKQIFATQPLPSFQLALQNNESMAKLVSAALISSAKKLRNSTLTAVSHCTRRRRRSFPYGEREPRSCIAHTDKYCPFCQIFRCSARPLSSRALIYNVHIRQQCISAANATVFPSVFQSVPNMHLTCCIWVVYMISNLKVKIKHLVLII